MAIEIKVGDMVSDDLTNTKAKVIEIIPRALPHYLPLYRIDSEYLDGIREAWEIWTDEQLKELEEELNK